MRLDFLHSLILSLSNSLSPDLTAMFNLTCTLLVKSRTHILHLFSQHPMTYTLSNAVYQVMSLFNLSTRLSMLFVVEFLYVSCLRPPEDIYIYIYIYIYI